MKKMVQVDLITGFLGAGKTTFLRRYVRYLVEQGHNVCILENDFGAVNVDAMLVQDLLGDRCDLETISGGCDCDTHQRRMRTMEMVGAQDDEEPQDAVQEELEQD